jgi:hypothetical protein
MRRILAFAAFVAVTTGAALAVAVPPSAMAGNPSNFDGKTVTATGTVKGFQTSSTMMGTVAGYQLCDSMKCIVVIDESNHAQTNGKTATVTGTFHATFKGPRKTFTNALVMSK